MNIFIAGCTHVLPCLPSVPGNEGVGDIVEVGPKVCCLAPGHRVIITKRLMGTWLNYGIYNERDVYRISSSLTLPEAAMIYIAPCTAFRLLSDFRKLIPGETIIQNAANSPVGQCIIQLCRIFQLKSINIVSSHCGYGVIKAELERLGATTVCTLEEAEAMCSFNTSLTRPVLAFNCLGGRFENTLLRLLDHNGVIVYYGSGYNVPFTKQVHRPDCFFKRFHYEDWSEVAPPHQKVKMLNKIVEYMVVGKLEGPLYSSIELKDYVFGLRNTAPCEAFATQSYIFDLTLS